MTLDEAIKWHSAESEKCEKLNRTATPYEGEACNEKARQNYAEYAEECRQLAEWLTELKQAKRLLKTAVSGFRYLGAEWMDHEDRCTLDCSICPLHNGYNCSHWNMQDEALKLIGEQEVNTND